MVSTGDSVIWRKLTKMHAVTCAAFPTTKTLGRRIISDVLPMTVCYWQLLESYYGSCIHFFHLKERIIHTTHTELYISFLITKTPRRLLISYILIFLQYLNIDGNFLEVYVLNVIATVISIVWGTHLPKQILDYP